MANVDLEKVPQFYHKYLHLVKENDLVKELNNLNSEFITFLRQIPIGKWDYRYAAGKWNIKEMLQHLIDAERIFGYRALSIARRDVNPLPGFDENKYAEFSEADRRSVGELIGEMNTVQKASQYLFSSFSDKQLQETGIANGKSIYVAAIGYVIIGHTLHHKNVLTENYL